MRGSGSGHSSGHHNRRLRLQILVIHGLGLAANLIVVLRNLVTDAQDGHEVTIRIGGGICVKSASIRIVGEHRLQGVGGNLRLRLAHQKPPLLPHHGLIIDIIHGVRVADALKRLLNRLLLQEPETKHLLLLVRQRKVRALDMDTVLDILLTVGVGLRTLRNEEAKGGISLGLGEG